jgi:hypothetical protein
MFKKLYIIGNGFDLHHGIPSSYSQFGAFLKRRDPETASLVETYFATDKDFWFEFESRLADFDAHSLIEQASDFLVSYAAEEWKDSYHHDYTDEINDVVIALSKTLQGRFAEWVRQIPIPDPSELGSLALTVVPTAAYLNFNYTASLQKLYKVADANILHIHGAAANPADQLVLGHGWQPAPEDSFNFGVDGEEADTRVLQGNMLIDRYFLATFKPTRKVIADCQPFFEVLRDVEQIDVMGHSLAKVDQPYFVELLRHLDPDRVTWRVSYHGESAAGPRKRFSVFGIPPARVSFLHLSEF